LPTIFVIDDDISALSSIVSTLTAARYEVQQARSIDQARHYLDAHDPDLILLEVDTDHGTGWDLLRDITRFEGPPTIIVSHRGREEEIVEALNIGAVDFLPKPFRTNELLARVRTRLGVPGADAAPTPTGERFEQPNDEAPVFMTHADEQPLLRATDPIAPGFTVDESLPLGARFRVARQGRKASLVQINLETKIPIWYLQAIEEEKFSLLPRGDVAAQMVRTYAEYLQLDGERALRDYRANYDSSPFRQLNSLGSPPPRREIPLWTGILIAALLALAIGIGTIWFVARDEMAVLGDNLRGLVTSPATTTTPLPTP